MTRFARFAWIVLATTILVVLWGAFVRASGSGAGCGSHWPMCNGEVIPRTESQKTLIEFTHRLTSGTSTILVFAQLIWAFRAYPRAHRVRRGAAASAFFIVTEGAVGAGLVLLKHVAEDDSIARVYWMATHLVNTFLLVASLTVTAWWASGGPAIRLRRQRGTGVTLTVFAALGATLLLGVTGAVTALGDTIFPANSLGEGIVSDFSPTAHVLLRLRVLHPVLAIVVAGFVLYAAGFFASRRASPIVRKLAFAAGTAFAIQIAAGFANLALLAPVAMQLLHLFLADAVWIALVLLSAAALGEEEETTTGVLATKAA